MFAYNTDIVRFSIVSFKSRHVVKNDRVGAKIMMNITH